MEEVNGMEPFELFAIRYATHSGRRASDNFMGTVDFHEADSDLDYFVWVARRGSEIFVIDTGFGEESADSRGRRLLMRPAKALTALGIDPADVENVIITHLHYDHAGTLDDFPRAVFHVQDNEPAYAVGRCMCHGALRHPYSVDDIVTFVRKLYAGRVCFHKGESELAPGISVHLIGGHTAGLQVVRVWTKRGWVVLASDATHLYGNIENEAPFPVVYNVADMLQGYVTVRELADSVDHIVPGHDPLVMKRYPSVEEDGGGNIVRLDAAPMYSK